MRERERVRESEREREGEREREREISTNLLEFSIFRKNRDQNLENRFPVSKFGRKKLRFPFPSRNSRGKK